MAIDPAGNVLASAVREQASGSDTCASIAVVDDDPAILRALERLIRSHGCEATVFSHVETFVDSAARKLPDCVILDVQMPGMSGLDLYQQLKDRGYHFPAIFITAHEDPAAEEQAKRLGATDFLYKPFRNRDLWEAICRALGRP